MTDSISFQHPPMSEAPMIDKGFGKEPGADGWFIVNVADAAGWQTPGRDRGVSFESRSHEFGHFEHFGVNIHVLEPGVPSCKYHNEPAQESFLVLRGECIVIIEDEERQLRAGDFVHCPPGARHVFIGSGTAPCAILMIGARLPEDGGGYFVSEVAAKYGASVSKFTDDPAVAYRDEPSTERADIDMSWIFADLPGTPAV